MRTCTRTSGTTLVALLAVTALLVTACAAAERSAAPVEAPASDAVPGAAEATGRPAVTSGEVSGAAEAKVIRTCISNDYTNPKSKVTLRWLRKGTVLTGAVRPTGYLFAGEQVCGERDTWSGGIDVDIYGPDLRLSVEQSDSSADDPNLMLRQSLDRVTFGRVCLGELGSSIPVGYAGTWDDGSSLVTVERLPDSAMYEISLTVTDSQSPSADGSTRQCEASAN